MFLDGSVSVLIHNVITVILFYSIQINELNYRLNIYHNREFQGPVKIEQMWFSSHKFSFSFCYFDDTKLIRPILGVALNDVLFVSHFMTRSSGKN
jgi:hypothetical protein